MPPSFKSPPHRSLPFCKFGFFLPLGEQLGSFDAASPYGRWIAGSVPTTTHGRCGVRTNAGFQVGQPRVETVQRQRHPKTGVLPKTKNSRKTPRPVPPHNTTHTHTQQTRLHGRQTFQNAPSGLHAATTVDRSLHSVLRRSKRRTSHKRREEISADALSRGFERGGQLRSPANRL